MHGHRIADPILLLAAAAAAVDSKHQEDVKERHRSVVGFERSHVTENKSNATAADVLGNPSYLLCLIDDYPIGVTPNFFFSREGALFD
jgi:hypothetical protein